MSDLSIYNGTQGHTFLPGEMEMTIVHPQSGYAWQKDNEDEAALSYYHEEMRRVELEKSELRRQDTLAKTGEEFTIWPAESDRGQDLRSFLMQAPQDLVVDIAVRLAKQMHAHNLDKAAQDELAALLPTMKVKPPQEITSKVSPEALHTILEAGLERFLKYILKQLPPESIFKYEVRFQNFSYTANLEVKETAVDTVGSQFLALLWPFRRKTTIQKKILSDLSGIIKAGKMTLVLGRPGSGKSSFLKAFSGMLHLDEHCVKTGDLIYNGEVDAGNLHVRRLTKYVGQRECHLPILTVRETLGFARMCLASSQSALGQDFEHIHNLKMQAVMLTLGLAHVGDTPVGDENIRGVSGGERRRVTLAEMMMGESKILCLDEISTGLDSSATFDIISSIRTIAHTMGSTFLISLLQPLPDTFHLFDELILLADGHIVFQGPIPQALEHFKSLGFEKPLRLDDADYLVQLTSEDADKIYRGGPLGPLTPTPAELAAAWKRHPTHLSQIQALMEPSPHPPATGEIAQKLFEQPFALSFWDQTKICLQRQILLTKRNLPFLRARIGQAVVMGLLSGSLFYNMSLENYQLRFGFLFFALLTMALNHMSGIPIVIGEKAVFFKQRSQNFLGIPQFVVSSILVQVPLVLVECLVFVSINYWLSALTGSDAGTHYAIFWIITVLTSLAMCAAYAAIAYSSPNLEAAQTFGGLFTVLNVVFAGFMIAASDIPGWWIWAHYLTPLSWSLRAVAVNEFMSPDFSTPVPSDPNRTVGEVYLDAFGFKTEEAWVGYGILVLIVQFFMYLLLGALGLRKSGFGIPNRVIVKPPEQVSGVPQAVSTGPVLKFISATLSFHDLTYSVSKKGSSERLTLLSGVYGYARPGTLTALMGSSGAGKTTLLDVLAGRKTTGKIEGQILVNGFPKDSTFSRMCGYCEQMDIHTHTATVHEALLFSARLRLEAQPNQIEAFVESVMTTLELWPIANNIVGGLSTEQAKRLTIGVELAANPSILFLDEPTSGLDARAAGIVMAAIKNVAATGRTVICTIHQPSSEIFENFDRLLLLKRGGQTVYFGPLGTRSESLIRYFEAVPGTKKCGESQNPASYMLDAIGAGVGNSVTTDFVNEYKRSALSRENDVVLEHILQNVNPAERVTFSRQYARSFGVQFIACMAKFFKSYWRMPEYNLVRTLFLIVVGVIFGSLYYKNDPTNRSGAFGRISVMYITALFIGFVNINTIVGVAIRERAVFYREKAAGMFNVSAYNIAAGLVEIPYQVFNSLACCVILYYMVGLKATAANFFFFWINFYMFTTMCTYFGQFLAAALPTGEVAAVMAPLAISIWNLFCGYLVGKSDIPDGYIFLYWLSPLHYYLEAVVTDQFHCDSGADCFEVATVIGSGDIINIPSDDFISSAFGMNYDNRLYDLLALFLFVILFRILSTWALARVNHNTR